MLLLGDTQTKVSSVETHVFFAGGTASSAWDLQKPGCGTNVGSHRAPCHVCHHIVSDGEHSSLHCVGRGPFPRNPAVSKIFTEAEISELGNRLGGKR